MLRNTAWAFGGQFVRLLTTLVLLGLLSPEARGFQALFVLLPTLAATLSMLGVPGALPVILHRGTDPQRLFRTLWTLALVIALVVSLVTIPALPWLAAYLGRSSATFSVTNTTVALGLLLFVPTVLGEFVRAWLVAQQRLRQYALSQTLQAAVQLALVVVIVGWGSGGAWGAVWATIASSWVGLGVTLALVGKSIDFRPAWDRATLQPLLRLGLTAHVGNTVQLLNYQLDTLLLNGLLLTAAATIAHYTTAVTLAGLVWNIPNAVALTLLPRVATGGKAITPQAARHTLLLASVSACGLLVAAWLLLTRLYPLYHSAWPALLVLLPGVVALSLSKVLASDLGGRGLPHYASTASVVTLAVTVVGDLVLIPRWGILGAALVSTVAYTLATLMITRSYLRVSGTPWRSLVPGRAEVVVYLALARRVRLRPRVRHV